MERFKNTLKTIVVPIVLGFLFFPTIALGGTYAYSLIQGKTPEEAMKVIALQVDAIIGRVDKLEIVQDDTNEKLTNLNSVIESQKNLIDQQEKTIAALKTGQSKQEKILYCQDLIKKTPQTGNILYINNDIVKYYEDIAVSKETNSFGKSPTSLDSGFLSEAKPLYDRYISECGHP